MAHKARTRLLVGALAASPRSDGPVFKQRTVRQIVHTSIGGSAARNCPPVCPSTRDRGAS
jgi:hypothetical protein